MRFIMSVCSDLTLRRVFFVLTAAIRGTKGFIKVSVTTAALPNADTVDKQAKSTATPKACTSLLSTPSIYICFTPSSLSILSVVFSSSFSLWKEPISSCVFITWNSLGMVVLEAEDRGWLPWTHPWSLLDVCSVIFFVRVLFNLW